MKGTKNPAPVAVASRSFSRHPVLRAELLARYGDVTFNDKGVILAGDGLLAFLAGRARAALGVLDTHLTARDWIVGAAMTVADLSCVGYMFYQDEFPIDWAADYPNLTAWRERIRALPGWRHPYDLMPGHNGESK